MNKNLIIGVLLFVNLLLTAALLLLWARTRTAPSAQSASNPRALAPTATSTEEELFTLRAGEHLNGDVAPQLAGSALTITATFDTQGSDGVIVAQGGLAHGYSLHVENGELIFAVRRNNALFILPGGKIETGRRIVTATLAKDGALTLAMDGKIVASSLMPGPLTLTPVDGIDVGADLGAPVGGYAVPNSFGGTIEVVTVKTTP